MPRGYRLTIVMLKSPKLVEFKASKGKKLHATI